MSDALDALLTRADAYANSFWRSQMVDDLAAALRECRADYLAALDVIARLTEGWDSLDAHGDPGDIPTWYREPILADEGEPDGDEPMSEREWQVFCKAAQRNHRSRT